MQHAGARPSPFPVSAVKVLKEAPSLCQNSLKATLGTKILLVDLEMSTELLNTGSEPGHLVLG